MLPLARAAGYTGPIWQGDAGLGPCLLLGDGDPCDSSIRPLSRLNLDLQPLLGLGDRVGPGIVLDAIILVAVVFDTRSIGNERQAGDGRTRRARAQGLRCRA